MILLQNLPYQLCRGRKKTRQINDKSGGTINHPVVCCQPGLQAATHRPPFGSKVWLSPVPGGRHMSRAGNQGPSSSLKLCCLVSPWLWWSNWMHEFQVSKTSHFSANVRIPFRLHVLSSPQTHESFSLFQTVRQAASFLFFHPPPASKALRLDNEMASFIHS